MNHYTWTESFVDGLFLLLLFLNLLDLAKWLARMHIEKMIRKTYRIGKVIHGPDL